MIGRVEKNLSQGSSRSGVRIGEPDRSLTGTAGLAAVTELDRMLALIATLEARVADV